MWPRMRCGAGATGRSAVGLLRTRRCGDAARGGEGDLPARSATLRELGATAPAKHRMAYVYPALRPANKTV